VPKFGGLGKISRNLKSLLPDAYWNLTEILGSCRHDVLQRIRAWHL